MKNIKKLSIGELNECWKALDLVCAFYDNAIKAEVDNTSLQYKKNLKMFNTFNGKKGIIFNEISRRLEELHD